MANLGEDLFRQNEWANLRLIEVCRALTEQQLDASEVGAYGSIRDTLVHLVRSEGTYVRHLGGTPARTLARDDPWPGFDAIEEAARAGAAGLIERAAAAREMIAFEQDGRRYELDPAVVLVQAINHSTEHRGQICTILTSLGVEPPSIDGWTWGEATGRLRPASG
jgi:uncharacterized damage-inducible protein DinB